MINNDQCTFGQVACGTVRTHPLCMMWFLIFAIVACFIAAGAALVRGLFAFYKDGELLKDGSAEADLVKGVQQNRMMAQRVFFQGLAVFAIALLGAFATSR